jgi:hypothetical protein
MSVTHAALSALAVGSVVGLLASNVIPSVAPIRVNSLTYSMGRIIEDHTVAFSNEEVALGSSRAIRFADSDDLVPNCSGILDRNYLVGRFVRTAPLAEWIGDPECTPESLAPGKYVPVEIYVAGSVQVLKRGEPFTIP